MTGDRKNGMFNWVALKLCGLILLVFLLQMAFPGAEARLELDSSQVLATPWTLVTYIFLHASFSHVLSNLAVLALTGSLLEKAVGGKNFLLVFFSSGIFSGAVCTLFYGSVIGASGAVFGVMAALAVLRPKSVVFVLGVPMYVSVAMLVYAALDLGGVFYPSDVANIGHLSASMFGVLIGLAWMRRFRMPEGRKEEKYELDEKEFRRWEETYIKRKGKKKSQQ